MTSLPRPTSLVDADDFTVRLTGIGGTGVVTVSQVLGTAAMLAGQRVRGLDQTGLSQKAGPVVSDLRITRGDTAVSNHANTSGVDCLLAFDLLVGASDSNLAGVRADRTVVVASTDAVPTGQMVTRPDIAPPESAVLIDRVSLVSRTEQNRFVDAAGLADALLGSTTAANILLLGTAVQAGAVPVPAAAIEEAITLNGVAVETNLAAFRWGRAWAADRRAVEARRRRSPPRSGRSRSTTSSIDWPTTSSTTSRSTTPSGSARWLPKLGPRNGRVAPTRRGTPRRSPATSTS